MPILNSILKTIRIGISIQIYNTGEQTPIFVCASIDLHSLYVYWSIGLLVYWSLGLCVSWSIGLLVY